MRKVELSTKKIKELGGITFRVPSYQRGYRWDHRNVSELLSDLHGFSPGPEGNERYCLQPIVLQKTQDGRESDDAVYEVIDGQQRLTTLLLIMKFAFADVPEEKVCTYKIQYVTRPGSESFLEGIASFREDEHFDNPDFYYMRQAWKTIETWVATHGFNQSSFRQEIIPKLIDSTIVIWYEVDFEVDQIALFQRLNIGRIPLTNAELIKGLLLSKLDDKNRALVANDWDTIEHTLQEGDFWYFLTDGKNVDLTTSTRIDLLFAIRTANERDSFRNDSFRSVEEELQKADHQPEQALEIWQEVKEIFSQLRSWYTNFVQYHRLGYLLAVGHMTPISLFQRLAGKDKTDIAQLTAEWISDSLRLSRNDLLALHYDTTNPALLRRILLLFNIETILAEKNSAVRFSFRAFKDPNLKWDVEHVQAITDRPPTLSKVDQEQGENLAAAAATERKRYLKSIIAELKELPREDESAISLLEMALTDKTYADEKKCEALFEERPIKESMDRLREDWNSLGNLALLDGSTNKSYKNACFEKKRQKIIRVNRGQRFIPPVTRNIFIGYFSQGEDALIRWSRSDRKRYLEGEHGLITTLLPYLREDHE